MPPALKSKPEVTDLGDDGGVELGFVVPALVARHGAVVDAWIHVAQALGELALPAEAELGRDVVADVLLGHARDVAVVVWLPT